MDSKITRIQNSEFLDFDHFESDIIDFVKNYKRTITPFINYFWGVGTGKHAQIWKIFGFGHFEPGIIDFVQNLQRMGSPIQNSKFLDFGHFEPNITDFVKNLYRDNLQKLDFGEWAQAEHPSTG